VNRCSTDQTGAPTGVPNRGRKKHKKAMAHVVPST
jgi:hypothetical protein